MEVGGRAGGGGSPSQLTGVDTSTCVEHAALRAFMSNGGARPRSPAAIAGTHRQGERRLVVAVTLAGRHIPCASARQQQACMFDGHMKPAPLV